jgi:hypothetical protein
VKVESVSAHGMCPKCGCEQAGTISGVDGSWALLPHVAGDARCVELLRADVAAWRKTALEYQACLYGSQPTSDAARSNRARAATDGSV